jgi:hypothetical protein
MARLFFFLIFLLLFSSVTGLRRSDFPLSFLFGAGTSSYQVRARTAAFAELSKPRVHVVCIVY